VASLAVFVLVFQGDNILSIDGSFLFIFISILCLIFILNATLFRPLNQVLEERERLSGGRLTEARQMLQQYEERLRRYEEQIRAARVESHQRIEEQRRQALARRQETLAQARAETAAQITAAKQEIAVQAQIARQNLEREARAMAASISANILQRPVTTPEGIGAS
jgi:F-type H+-transporting ATPase subunit b